MPSQHDGWRAAVTPFTFALERASLLGNYRQLDED